MPSTKVELKLAPPINGEFYGSEDQISGEVNLKLEKSLPIKKISVKLHGFAQTITTIDNEYIMGQNGLLTPGFENRSYHTLITAEERVFPPDNVWDALNGSTKPFKVNPGQYHYTFKFDKLKNKKPKCLKTHKKEMVYFNKRRTAKMPPSFNNLWKELNRIDNLDLYFYSFGKVIYVVEVLVELGKAKTWLKPFDKLIRESQPIEYIPDIDDVAYDEHDLETDTINNISRHNSNLTGMDRSLSNRSGSNKSFAAQIHERSVSNSSLSQYNSFQKQFTSTASSEKLKAIRSRTSIKGLEIYKSTFQIGLPDNVSTLWLEVRTKSPGIDKVFRMDPLFKKGCNKFDNIFLIIQNKSNMSIVKDLSVKPIGITLNLFETTTYLSQGIANQNVSSLRLVDLKLDGSESIFSMQSNLTKKGDDIYECELNLKDHVRLKNFVFNEEDYRHRGNRLYSFKTCSIKRIFELQLLVDWDVNGYAKQTEVIIDSMQVFAQLNNIHEDNYLPRYIEPPNYNDLK
ncbi:hypothetical protein KAFR_0A05940 [Kazachstania africana CBS 2517]|uniref:Arrestin-like N-terminal domain-containing protein n=1 Tax=Kazachstania africana (strain ATCC 22294 / BCRC 22015 / CBS 2517 / CECT 1963 / NBRC 1671 / NRRL Y-8276) TaxID=1071382 RepID=H2ANS9_KAZAF|nr:hypothetical protein KAFR_0A05940 [Kazachstania africana CBS 2517]CCF56029.1 hypothetical protein KAFR_0A05940 [Kazachstania africana CBS 2517]